MALMARASARKSPLRMRSTQLEVWSGNVSSVKQKCGGALILPREAQSFSNCRAITIRWISLVPSPMVHSLTSR